jgi:hypothetical protein
MQVFVHNRDSGNASSSGDQNSEHFWKSIWKLPVVPKIQQFIWRLAHDSLPLRTKIKKIGIECDTLCSFFFFREPAGDLRVVILSSKRGYYTPIRKGNTTPQDPLPRRA